MLYFILQITPIILMKRLARYQITKTAFTDELGTRYWVANIGEGVKQYTINTPKDLNSLELVKRNMSK